MAREQGTPVEGICLYPIIDRFDWQNAGTIGTTADCGISSPLPMAKLVRTLNEPYAAALRTVQATLATAGCI